MYVVSRKLFLKQVPLYTPEWEILLSLKKNYACFYWKILLDVCSDRPLVLGKMAKNSNSLNILPVGLCSVDWVLFDTWI